MLHDVFKRTVLDTWIPATYPNPHPSLYMSIHSSYSAVGGNELYGGDPPYQRMPTHWFGVDDFNPDGPFMREKRGQQASISAGRFFEVPAGSSIRFFGLFDQISGGNFLGMFPIGGLLNNQYPHVGWDGNPLQTFVIDDTPTTLVRCAHNIFHTGIQMGEFLSEFGVQSLEVVYWSASRNYNTMPEMTHGETIMTVTDISEHNFRLIAPGDASPHVWTQTGFGFFQMSRLLYTPIQRVLSAVEMTIAIHGSQRNGAA